MIRETKAWGERWKLREDSTHSTNVLRVLPGYRCSWHRHACKWNLFVVLDGSITIETEDGGSIDLTVGEEFTIRPGIYHEFRSTEGALIVEEMYVEYDDKDIERSVAGGKIRCPSIPSS